MKKTLFIFAFIVTTLSGFAQWNTDRILTIGRNALYFEDYVLSIQYFNQVIKIKPYLAEPYMYRAMAKIQLGDDKGAELDANEAIERNPFMPQAYYIRGFARRRLSLYADAANDFSRALEFSPASFNLLMNRMDALMRLEDYEGAMRDLETYMRQNSKNPALFYEKGIIQLAMKDTLAAENSFNELLIQDSTNNLGWSARALLRMQKNDIEGAYADYSKSIALNSNYFGDYINRGILNVRRKNFREALSDYDKAISLDNKSELAYYNRALLRANLGDNNNALDDFNKVLELDTTNTEALFQRAMLHNTLRQFKNAIADYKLIIEKYPYFLPAYWGIAEAETGLGNVRNAFKYRQMAADIEKNKDKIQKQQKEDELVAGNKMVKGTARSNQSRKTELFNRFVTQNIDDSKTDSKYTDSRRGNVQDKFVDVVNERNFVLSYYARNEEIRRTNLYHAAVDDYNKKHLLGTALKITNNEIPLTSELVNTHFEVINEVSSRLENESFNADLYFYRAVEFGLVQDFNSAIEDLNKALAIRPDFAIAYFTRANIRNKLLDYLKSTTNDQANTLNEARSDKSNLQLLDNQYKFEAELIIRDYDKVNELLPDFAFSYFNKANIMATQKDFRAAILFYSKAIEADNEFAEAFYNRGLTYLFTGDDKKGLADLSKAGELGIYKVYNLIQRFGK
ncbi:MAG: tetratricopeptide repeat protein [Paludibacteraceae bacterium]|nr:tetratricopeptide repeat protein [Paludibacteraceae bacterium]